MFSWPVFFGSLFTGLLGVGISVVSAIAYNNYAEMRRLRVDCVASYFVTHFPMTNISGHSTKFQLFSIVRGQFWPRIRKSSIQKMWSVKKWRTFLWPWSPKWE